MRTYTRARLPWLVVGLLGGLAVGYVAGRSKAVPPAGPPRLTAGVLKDAERVAAERFALLPALAGTLTGSASTPVERVRAAELIGDLHETSPRIVTALMGQLALSREAAGLRPPPDIRPPPEEWTFPCLDALVDVGLPAVHAAIGDLGRPQSAQGRRLRLELLDRLLGTNARPWLEEAERDARAAETKAALRRALEHTFTDRGAYDAHMWRGRWVDEPWYTPQSGRG